MAQGVHRDENGNITLVESDQKVTADSEFAVQIPPGVESDDPMEVHDSEDSDKARDQNEKDSKDQAKRAQERAKNQSRDRFAEQQAENASKPQPKSSKKDE